MQLISNLNNIENSIFWGYCRDIVRGEFCGDSKALSSLGVELSSKNVDVYWHSINKMQDIKNRDGYPYFIHVLRCCYILTFFMGKKSDEIKKIINYILVHDYLEEGVTNKNEWPNYIETLKRKFGKRIAGAAVFLTEPNLNKSQAEDEDAYIVNKVGMCIQLIAVNRVEYNITLFCDLIDNIIAIIKDEHYYSIKNEVDYHKLLRRSACFEYMCEKFCDKCPNVFVTELNKLNDILKEKYELNLKKVETLKKKYFYMEEKYERYFKKQYFKWEELED